MVLDLGDVLFQYLPPLMHRPIASHDSHMIKS